MRGLKFIDNRTDQEMGEYGGLSDTDKSLSPSCSEGQGEETVIVYDVQPWMKEAEVRSILSATKAAEPKRLRPVSWRPGDMDLAAWRVQGPGVEAAIGSVIRDSTTGQNVYVISLRQYSSERTRKRESAKRRREQATKAVRAPPQRLTNTQILSGDKERGFRGGGGGRRGKGGRDDASQ